MNVTEEQKTTTKNLIIEGKSIEAIKYVRKELNLDLKTAMRLVKGIRETIDPALLKTTSSFGTQFAPRSSKLIPVIFGIIGLAMLGAGFYVFSSQQRIINQEHKTLATVVSNPSSPLFEYEFNGQVFNYQSSTSSNPPSYFTGEQVGVYIDANDPNNIIIDTFTDRWLLIVILAAIGSSFLGVSLLMLYLNKK